MREIEFTEEEANSLINLLDIAVKSQGLNAANNALVLVNKLQVAFKEPPVAENIDLEKPKKK